QADRCGSPPGRGWGWVQRPNASAKAEGRMTKSEEIPKPERRTGHGHPIALRHSGFGILSSFVICHSSLHKPFRIPMPAQKRTPLHAVPHRGPFRCLATVLIAGLMLLGFDVARGAETNKVQHATLKISGCGMLGNRELKKTIRLMSGRKTPPEFYDA